MTDVEIHFDGVNVTGGTIELCEDQGAQYLESVGGIDYDVCRSLTNPCVFSLIPVPTVRFWFPPEQPQPPQSEFVYLIDTSEPGTFGITNGVDGGPSDCQAPGNESREASVTVVVKDKCLGTSGFGDKLAGHHPSWLKLPGQPAVAVPAGSGVVGLLLHHCKL